MANSRAIGHFSGVVFVCDDDAPVSDLHDHQMVP